MIVVVVIMQGVLASINFPLSLLPMLEVVQTITEPLLSKLRFHFASGRPTDRIDQPDWLFETAARATGEHLESFKALQPAVQSHGLEKVFYLPFEFARAMHAAVQTLLQEHVLPRLSQQVSLHSCLAVCSVSLCFKYLWRFLGLSGPSDEWVEDVPLYMCKSGGF